MFETASTSLTHQFKGQSNWETAEHLAIGITEDANGNYIRVGFSDNIHGYEHAIHLAQLLRRRYETSVKKPTDADPSSAVIISSKKQGVRLTTSDVVHVLTSMEQISAIAPVSQSIAADQLALQVS